MKIIREGVVKTRKPHRCWGCRIALPVGSVVFRVVSEDGGTVGTAYWCERCDALLRDNPDWCEDGLVFGELAGMLEGRA